MCVVFEVKVETDPWRKYFWGEWSLVRSLI